MTTEGGGEGDYLQGRPRKEGTDGRGRRPWDHFSRKKTSSASFAEYK